MDSVSEQSSNPVSWGTRTRRTDSTKSAGKTLGMKTPIIRHYSKFVSSQSQIWPGVVDQWILVDNFFPTQASQRRVIARSSTPLCFPFFLCDVFLIGLVLYASRCLPLFDLQNKTQIIPPHGPVRVRVQFQRRRRRRRVITVMLSWYQLTSLSPFLPLLCLHCYSFGHPPVMN